MLTPDFCDRTPTVIVASAGMAAALPRNRKGLTSRTGTALHGGRITVPGQSNFGWSSPRCDDASHWAP